MEEEEFFISKKEYEDRLTERIQNLYKKIGESEDKKRDFNDTLVRKMESRNMKVIYLPVGNSQPDSIVVNPLTGIEYLQFGFGIESEDGILIAPCSPEITIDEYNKYMANKTL
jgi:hypothetical protein